jgi:hypothetical protein
VSLAAVPAVSDAQQTAGATLPAWLSGCWGATPGGIVIEEHWMTPRAGTMLGMSRSTRGTTTVGFELVILRVEGSDLIYEAHPSNQPSAAFTLSNQNDTVIVFANPEHDFPQRLGYQRLGPDSVSAWIEGVVEGTTRRVVFPYARARCPSP